MSSFLRASAVRSNHAPNRSTSSKSQSQSQKQQVKTTSKTAKSSSTSKGTQNKQKTSTAIEKGSKKNKSRNTHVSPKQSVKRYGKQSVLTFSYEDQKLVGMSVSKFLKWVKDKESRRAEINAAIERDCGDKTDEAKPRKLRRAQKGDPKADMENRYETVEEHLQLKGRRVPFSREEGEVSEMPDRRAPLIDL